MALEKLRFENWIDIREAIQRRLKEVVSANVITTEAKNEQARRINSLNESLTGIEELCRALKYKEDKRDQIH